ncbi:glutamate synthase-related protein [Streptomyces sp. UNOC14_S4]|uniref:glutamate synthase-related protein n=1 Tax=Streptomyces sp. UNOC14_S4 TaxID=2872340 RepID=UPI001E5CC29F|nr:glutamate synthase-related protein [Streptomyces sp. UNOC14_S4]MCC3772360.1 alpha-hydroxy-acid oxidizing protein [Streptomyces sp. UNOC14_S4]
MTASLTAEGFAEDDVRERARTGAAAVFPPHDEYGHRLFGARTDRTATDPLDTLRLVPPVLMPHRLEKLVELAREPHYGDVDLTTDIGGFRSTAPVYVSAFGSTQVADSGLGTAASRQAGRLGIPMVIGENIVPTVGYTGADTGSGGILARLRAYESEVPDGVGGIAFQQSTEDADAEVWNLIYSAPSAQNLLETGRLAFELKVGQGAKPGLGGMTVVGTETAARLAEHFTTEDVFGDGEHVLRSSSPGTFTEEILRQQIRFMRNNYPRARVWVKLPPGRDVRTATAVAWEAGADAVTVDGAEGGSGWAPRPFFDHVGLPLAECLRRVRAWEGGGCLLASGRMWEGSRVAKALALGARAAGLGRAALLAVDENPDDGLDRLLACLTLELRLIISALGKYAPAALAPEDVWSPTTARLDS